MKAEDQIKELRVLLDPNTAATARLLMADPNTTPAMMCILQVFLEACRRLEVPYQEEAHFSFTPGSTP